MRWWIQTGKLLALDPWKVNLFVHAHPGALGDERKWKEEVRGRQAPHGVIKFAKDLYSNHLTVRLMMVG